MRGALLGEDLEKEIRDNSLTADPFGIDHKPIEPLLTQKFYGEKWVKSI